MIVSIRALNIIDHKNGTFSIELPDRSLTEAEQKFLREIFPNLLDRVYDIMGQEALLGSLATDEEVHKERSKSKRDLPDMSSK